MSFAEFLNFIVYLVYMWIKRMKGVCIMEQEVIEELKNKFRFKSNTFNQKLKKRSQKSGEDFFIIDLGHEFFIFWTDCTGICQQ